MLRDATQFQPGKLRSEYFWPGLGAHGLIQEILVDLHCCN
jgi:hypothetical protein